MALLRANNVMSVTEDEPNSIKLMNNTNFDVSNLVHGLESRPYNTSYADWTEKWWQWIYSIPTDRNPSYDDTGKYCGENQKGPVWFLIQSFEHDVVRTCEVPRNTSLLIPLLNSECSYAEFPYLKTEQELNDCAKVMQNVVSGGNATLDGTNVPNLENYRVQTSLYNLTLPGNNILNLSSQITRSVADGNWLFLKPLAAGVHELKVKGDINSTAPKIEIHGNEIDGPIGWNQTTSYILKVE